ncbi:MAG: ribonuclease Y [Verrucomicrobiales bacterium]|nr:ribonuclease Y [Verrucomicrobiales bacterium]
MDPFLPVNLLVGGTGLLAAGSLLLFVKHRRETGRLRRESEDHAQALLADARRDAEAMARDAKLQAAEELARLRDQAEQQHQRRRTDLDEMERRLLERERLVNQQLERLSSEEERVRGRAEDVRRLEVEFATRLEEQQREQERVRTELERVAGLSASDARDQVLRQAREETMHDAARMTRHVIEEAQTRAEEKARHLLATVVQRYAGEYTFESTTTSIAITSDEIKGRIIGREGRNIRAFESATGVTVLIDDTPNAVVISGFDPVRRAVAREAMSRLIADGRIHPTRIEEVVGAVQREMEENIVRLGEEAVAKVGLAPLHLETTRLLGRLRFRHSFSQNILDHSIEVARLCGLLAAELGENVEAAKRSGLLHDLGKAVTHEMEGPHALVGAELLRQHGEDPRIVNAVASHHQEVESEGPLGVLVSAADAISASRPGARSETMSTYLKRVENLERIGASFPGVEKCFAVQAGRELRVLVRPEQLDDDAALLLARAICRKIEDELQYPGQIRVTLVRELRCVEYAK